MDNLGKISYSLSSIKKGNLLKTFIYLLIVSTLFVGCTTSEPKPVKNSAAAKTDFAAQGIQTKRALETQQEVLLNADT